MRALGLPFSLRRLATLLLLTPGALHAEAVHAEPALDGQPSREAQPHPGPAWLSYRAPPECPQADFIEERVTEWLKGPIPPESELSARGEVRWTDGKWEVTVTLESQGVRGVRQVGVDQCAEAAEFVALTVVLALDPSFVVEAGAAGAPTEPATSAGTEGKSKQIAEREPEEASTPSASPQPRRTHFLSVDSSFLGASGIFPQFAWGVSGRVGWQAGLWELAAGLVALPTVGTEQTGAVSVVDYSLLSGLVAVCTRFSGGALFGGPCGGAWLGQLSTSAINRDGSGRQTEQFWASLQAGARGGLHLGSHFDVFAGAYFSMPLTRTSFQLSDLSEVHRPGPGVAAELGIRLSWPLQRAPQ